VEHGWKEAAMPSMGNDVYKGIPSVCLPLSPIVSDPVSGSGSEIAGQEAKAGSWESDRPKEPWHTQEPISYFPEQTRAETHAPPLSFSFFHMPAASLSKAKFCP
jgi:hypothetical protein